jgi:hypothetical protein
MRLPAARQSKPLQTGSIYHLLAQGRLLNSANNLLDVYSPNIALPARPFSWQAGLGAVERLDLRLLIDRQHHCMRRRVEADDLPEPGTKSGSLESLK